MEDRAFNSALADLRRRIDALPSPGRGSLLDLYAETEARYFQLRSAGDRTLPSLRDFDASLAKLKAATHLVEDRTQELRLQAKLRLFQLEAEARERNADPSRRGGASSR